MSDQSEPATDQEDIFAAARQQERELQDAGIAIVSEEPEFITGRTTRYRIVGKHLDNDREFEAMGDSRDNAIKALIVASKAS